MCPKARGVSEVQNVAKHDMYLSREFIYCGDVPLEQCVNIYLFVDWKE